MCGRSHVVIGAGPVGRAVALQLAGQPDTLVVLIDRSHSVLAAAQGLLGDLKNVRFDGSLGPCALSIQARSLIMATSWNDCRNLVGKLAHQMHEAGLHTPIICVGRPDPEDPDIARMPPNGPPVVLGAGLEPGLVESLISLAAAELDGLESIVTHCGGIPKIPEPPLNYALAFGRRLPIGQRPALARVNGRAVTRNRFESVSSLFVEGVGLLEAYDDAMVPSTAASTHLSIPTIRQLTVRWPGFADGVRMLHRLGLLSDEEVEIGSARLRVKHVTEALLTRRSPKEHDDQVILDVAIEDRHRKPGRWTCILRSALQERGFSSMAIATAVPVAAAVECVMRKQLRGAIHPGEATLAEVASMALGKMRGSRMAVLAERATGLLETTTIFGAGNAKAENTARGQRTSKPCTADVPERMGFLSSGYAGSP
ncbi:MULTISPECIES: saccharopine dehydrogenase family protein [Mesorhizobium]|nr:saccharopine dehydrogenase C-terminal domain-containing protein [Mesorhizobium sp. VK23D]MDX8522378.1 saccharopine dehydrogenase C-terminal domain-containing protein [Mesorhizobium sp. VK23D]